MITKRLKDCKFEYEGDGNPIEIYITARRDGVYLYKRQALALLKFLLENLDLTDKEWIKITEAIKDNGSFNIETLSEKEFQDRLENYCRHSCKL